MISLIVRNMILRVLTQLLEKLRLTFLETVIRRILKSHLLEINVPSPLLPKFKKLRIKLIEGGYG